MKRPPQGHAGSRPVPSCGSVNEPPAAGWSRALYGLISGLGRSVRRRAPSGPKTASQPARAPCRQRQPDEGRDLEGDTGASCYGLLQPPGVSNDNPFSKPCSGPASTGRNGRPRASATSRPPAVVARFANWYNGEHLHSGIRFVAPTRGMQDTITPCWPRAPASGQGAPGKARTVVRTAAQLGAVPSG